MDGDVAFVDDLIVPKREFDWSAIEPEERDVFRTELKKQSAAAVANFCLRTIEFGGASPKKFFQAAHAFAYAAHIHPQQDQPLKHIARLLHIRKQAFNKQVNRIRDALQLPRERNRPTTRCGAYAGRAAFLRKLKSEGKTFAQAFKAACARFPGSSEANCRRSWGLDLDESRQRQFRPMKALSAAHHLNRIAEWVAQQNGSVENMPAQRRQMIRSRLEPIIRFYSKL